MPLIDKQQTASDPYAWARAALRENSARLEGLSREDISRRAVAVCSIAAETGETIAAANILAKLTPTLKGCPQCP